LRGEIVASPIPGQVSIQGEPTWEIAQLFPSQGDWTEADYFALDTRRLVELSEGRLEFLPMPTIAHQVILSFLNELLKAFIAKHDPGGLVLFAPVKVRLWAGKIREPDLVYLRSDHRSRAGKHFEGADLALEIVSPDNAKHDRETKWIEYAQAGIPEYWLVDPLERYIIVYVLENKQYRQIGLYAAGTVASSVTVVGFSVVVEEMFQLYDEAVSFES
jgi:Uma2 family endonuclease